jgi:hypothetical protein
MITYFKIQLCREKMCSKPTPDAVYTRLNFKFHNYKSVFNVCFTGNLIALNVSDYSELDLCPLAVEERGEAATEVVSKLEAYF